jgi:hypothetical protein
VPKRPGGVASGFRLCPGSTAIGREADPGRFRPARGVPGPFHHHHRRGSRMSTGQEFDPSLLEGKDRNELVAIATSST